MKETEYTPQYYIDKFVKTRSTDWCKGEFDNGNGQYCALGHCGYRIGQIKGRTTLEGIMLRGLFIEWLGWSGITDVSDGGVTKVTLKKSRKVIRLSSNLGSRGRVLKVLRAIVKEMA